MNVYFTDREKAMYETRSGSCGQTSAYAGTALGAQTVRAEPCAPPSRMQASEEFDALLSKHVEGMIQLGERLKNVTGRLMGYEPEANEVGKDAGHPGSLIDRVNYKMEMLTKIGGRISHEIERLEGF